MTPSNADLSARLTFDADAQTNGFFELNLSDPDLAGIYTLSFQFSIQNTGQTITDISESFETTLTITPAAETADSQETAF